MATILVVEDTDDVRMALHRLFSRAGFTVMEAEDGRAALERAHRQPPDVILTDLNMPHLDGLQLCQAIREDEGLSDIPVAILTGGVQPGDPRFAHSHVCGVWLKPFNNAELVAAVQRLVQGGRHRHFDDPSSCPYRAA
ncbi:response regulator [Couchioplanes azureus]|uniref:response regulator n=1 Tax=Couchioplanes caeruleus TaxID=56438 RepID=UPI00166F6AA0|nr:response regulator [Couchioplanes caeruleus]GGQ42911.1 response regulator [Couchioplanes caeruleus subsp. azureus]